MVQASGKLRTGRWWIVGGSVVALLAAGDGAGGQTQLPEIRISPPRQAPKRVAAPPRRVVRRVAPPAPAVPAEPPAVRAAREVARQTQTFDQARDKTLLPKIGTSTYDLDREALEALPQGTNAPVDKVLLQAPGVHQDSAASGLIHVRNEHANVQYRINGIFLPDGVAGLGQVLETSFIGNIALVTGALPAQYGFRTSSGLVDITTRSPSPEGSGSASIYGGSRQTITPSLEYGGIVGKTEYFVIGRYFASNTGIENPTASLNPIHDYTSQNKFFAYSSTLVDETTRVSTITGSSVSKFQIPAIPGQAPNFCSGCATDVPGFDFGSFDSRLVNENQVERNYYGVVAVQKKVSDLDLQVAYFTRYSSVHFVPDAIGDLVFNGVASDVYRNAFVNGIQADGAYRLDAAHTLRTGVFVSAEATRVVNTSVAFQTDADGNPLDVNASPPVTAVDANSKTGWLMGTYVQDEWKLTDRLTLNLGLRFDQMVQFVDANQFSPRAGLVYRPFEGTTFHAGYARYFTPPSQIIATPTNLALFSNTTQQPAISQGDPVLPERSHYFDAGVVQKVLPGLEVGLDAYYKIARDLLDDGQFGQALVLNGFNYDKGINAGLEAKVRYQNGNFRAYGNLAWAKQTATDVVSNQFLFDPARLAFIATHWIYTDHAQWLTGSAGVSYLCFGTRYGADMIFGSGLRSGFANTDHVPAYAQVNVGVSREFKVPDGKPFTLRFDVVNVLDTVYEIRDGTGIGVFAPQFGPRRGYYMGLSQKL